MNFVDVISLTSGVVIGSCLKAEERLDWELLRLKLAISEKCRVEIY